MLKKYLHGIAFRRRWLSSGLFALLALTLVGGSSLASGWCRADPIIQIEDEQVQIWASIPAEYQAAVNGPIKVTVALPTNKRHAVVFTDSGFNGYGERVIFVDGGKATGNRYEIDVHVEIPFNRTVNAANVPLQVEIITELGTQIHTGRASGVTVTKVIVPKHNY